MTRSEGMITMRPASWPDGRAGLAQLIRDIELGEMSMIEVGSYRGESAEIFMDSGKVSRMICVDPWQAGYDDADKASFSDMAKVEADFDARMSKYGGRVRKFKGTLQQLFQEGVPSADFVYVDSCHTYDGCKADVLTALAAKPAYIGGHDYNGGFQGVVDAVNETVGAPDKVYPDTSWIKKLGNGGA